MKTFSVPFLVLLTGFSYAASPTLGKKEIADDKTLLALPSVDWIKTYSLSP